MDTIALGILIITCVICIFLIAVICISWRLDRNFKAIKNKRIDYRTVRSSERRNIIILAKALKVTPNNAEKIAYNKALDRLIAELEEGDS